MDNRQANINRFEAEMTKVTRDGVDKLMAFIRKSDMYAAPASTRFHLSVTGGLLQHSLNVLDALRANLTKNDDGTYSYEVAGVPAVRVTEENVIIMALLHDICKTYFYTTGKRGESKHSLLVLTERKTRNELIYLLYEHTTEQVCKRLDQLEAEWGERFGQVFKTIPVDNGSEFADWEGMQQSAADESEKRVTVFYCHPYCSFERGSNENQNRLVRRKIPKGENFDDRTEDDIQRVENWINDYPREMFGWKTSGELFQEELARLA